MLSEYQEYLKRETLERLSDNESQLLDESTIPPHKKSAKLLEVACEVVSESGQSLQYNQSSIEGGSGKAKVKLDGWFLDTDNGDLYVYSSNFDDLCEGKATQKQIYSQMSQVRRFVENSLRASLTDEVLSGDGLDVSQKLRKSFEDQEFKRVVVVVVTNQISALGGEQIADGDNPKLGLDFRYEVYDSERLEKLSTPSGQRSDIYIDLEEEIGRPLECLEVLPPKDDYNTYLTIFSGDLIYNLFDEYGPRLFEFNVRSFLQARSKVNKGIRDTLQKDPEMFLAYNNGLVATVDEIDISFLDKQAVIHSMRGLQVVNGAQTTSSIYATKKKYKCDLKDVSVPVKITKVSENRLAEFVPLISKYANSQNNIQVADLSANHPIHIKVENLSRSIWTPGEQSQWFYERTRGSYESEMLQSATTAKQKRDFNLRFPRVQKFDKTELAKYVVCWDLRRPFQVALGNQKNFAIFMRDFDEYFGKDWAPDEDFFRRIVSVCILFKAIRKAYMQQKTGFPAPVTALAISHISQNVGDTLDLDKVWQEQNISFELENLIRDFVLDVNRVFVDSAGDRNPSEWAKKEECWKEILEQVSPIELQTAPEFVYEVQEEAGDDAPTTTAKTISEVRDRIMEMTPTEMAAIALWGRGGSLKKIEIGCLNTVANYAAEDWAKKPSDKQMRHIARALSVYDSQMSN